MFILCLYSSVWGKGKTESELFGLTIQLVHITLRKFIEALYQYFITFVVINVTELNNVSIFSYCLLDTCDQCNPEYIFSLLLIIFLEV